ncbi:hypothetical protein WMY93_002826 [Mugilogobius chulae]|uniref:Uncharacterized protein n=1 Tax=Mugilogobius chulae TaxID=88201 RepID=A0AAW0Q386_9GOBI
MFGEWSWSVWKDLTTKQRHRPHERGGRDNGLFKCPVSGRFSRAEEQCGVVWSSGQGLTHGDCEKAWTPITAPGKDSSRTKGETLSTAGARRSSEVSTPHNVTKPSGWTFLHTPSACSRHMSEVHRPGTVHRQGRAACGLCHFSLHHVPLSALKDLAQTYATRQPQCPWPPLPRAKSHVRVEEERDCDT